MPIVQQNPVFIIEVDPWICFLFNIGVGLKLFGLQEITEQVINTFVS